MSDFKQITLETMNHAFKSCSIYTNMGQAILAALNSSKPLTNFLILTEINNLDGCDFENIVNALGDPEKLYTELESLITISGTPEVKQSFIELLEFCKTYHTLRVLSDDFIFIPEGSFADFAETMQAYEGENEDPSTYMSKLSSKYHTVSIDAPYSLGYSGNLMYLPS